VPPVTAAAWSAVDGLNGPANVIVPVASAAEPVHS
jgi:hypothetical protein